MSSPMFMKRPSQCRMCQRMFRSKDALMKHVNTFHLKSSQTNNEAGDVVTQTNKTKFPSPGDRRRTAPLGSLNGEEPIVLTIDDSDEEIMSVAETSIKINAEGSEMDGSNGGHILEVDVEGDKGNGMDGSCGLETGWSIQDDVMEIEEVQVAGLETGWKNNRDDVMEINEVQVASVDNNDIPNDAGKSLPEINKVTDVEGRNPDPLLSESEGESIATVIQRCQEQKPESQDVSSFEFVDTDDPDLKSGPDKIEIDTFDAFKTANDTNIKYVSANETKPEGFVLVDISKIIADKVVLDEINTEAVMDSSGDIDVTSLTESISTNETDDLSADIGLLIQDVQSLANCELSLGDDDVIVVDDDEDNNVTWVSGTQEFRSMRTNTQKMHGRFQSTTRNRERPFQCNICFKRLSSPVTLKQHKKNMHEKRSDFKCPRCSKHLPSKRELTYHVEEVHGKLVCKICPESFKSEMGLQNHVMVDHRQQKELITID